MSTKEKQFAKAYAQDYAALQELVTTAEIALKAALALSDRTGLPFETAQGIYTPDKFHTDFHRIDLDFVETLTDIASWDLEQKTGWSSSSADC